MFWRCIHNKKIIKGGHRLLNPSNCSGIFLVHEMYLKKGHFFNMVLELLLISIFLIYDLFQDADFPVKFKSFVYLDRLVFENTISVIVICSWKMRKRSWNVLELFGNVFHRPVLALLKEYEALGCQIIGKEANSHFCDIFPILSIYYHPSKITVFLFDADPRYWLCPPTPLIYVSVRSILLGVHSTPKKRLKKHCFMQFYLKTP